MLRRAARRTTKGGGAAEGDAPTGPEAAAPAVAEPVAAPADGPITIRTMDGFEEILKRGYALNEERGYSAMIDFLNGVRFEPSMPPPADPYSPEYREFMIDLYKSVSGRHAYDPEQFEKANLSLRSVLEDVWPYASGDPVVVGSYFMGVSHITRLLGSLGAKTVFEYGVGWGHTSLMLAQAGMSVTASDIETVFLDRLEAIVANDPRMDLRTIGGRFGVLPDAPEHFDAFLFFECFHHCIDFLELVPRLRERLRPGGAIVLAGEPMLKADAPPWSVRLDGHSLWAARTHGWMELGFREDFLIDVFAREGFDVTTSVCDTAGEVGFAYVFTKR
jgi:SAM-dependent methyltransferase